MTEWQSKKLIELVAKNGLVRGPFGGALVKSMFKPDGFKVYEQKNAIYQNVQLGHYYIDEQVYEKLTRFAVRPGDFIVSCSGTIGRIYRIPINAPKGVINQALLKITLDETQINSNYFYQYFKWSKFQSKIIDSTQGGAMQNLVGMDIFRNTKFSLPDIKEQDRITQILDTWDRNNEKLVEIITHYKRLLTGSTQQLLTGKYRIPGFTDTWESTTLGAIATINPASDGLPEKFQYIDLEIVQDGRLTRTPRIVKKRDAPSRAQRLLNKEDILFQTVRPYQRNNLYFNYDGDFVASTGYAQLRAKNSPRFLYYFIQSDDFVTAVLNMCTGSSYPAINSSDLSKVKIRYPREEEQIAIAKVLSTIDNVITDLKIKLEQTHRQKNYLLENLITGKIRVPESLNVKEGK